MKNNSWCTHVVDSTDIREFNLCLSKMKILLHRLKELKNIKINFKHLRKTFHLKMSLPC